MLLAAIHTCDQVCLVFLQMTPNMCLMSVPCCKILIIQQEKLIRHMFDETPISSSIHLEEVTIDKKLMTVLYRQ